VAYPKPCIKSRVRGKDEGELSCKKKGKIGTRVGATYKEVLLSKKRKTAVVQGPAW